jgi:15-cis-phytoene synthase
MQVVSERVHSTAADREACRAAIRAGSRTFYAASWLLPAKVRAAAIDLYAFCRMADDAIDQSGAPHAALSELQRRLTAVYAGDPHDAPSDRALSRVVHAYRMPMAIPGALLEGFAWDAEGRRYETLADLEAYCVRVAGTVGVMMALLMGVRSVSALARAADLGVAMQLSNIARDVGEDARAGRLYLPLAWMREANVDTRRFMAEPRFDERVASVVARLVDAARHLYVRSIPGIDELPGSCRPAIHAARLIYAEIGEELMRHAGDSVSSRTVVSSKRKCLLLMRAIVAATRSDYRSQASALPAAQFLVDAVRDASDAPPRFAVGPDTCTTETERGRLARVFDIFERLEARDRATAAQA